MFPALLTAAALAAGPVAPAEPELWSVQRTLMTTNVAVGIVDPLPDAARAAAAEEAFAVFAAIDRDLNEWKPDSALSRVNAGAGGPAVDAPAELCDVVRLSLDGARRTAGLFDPTWAALRGLWKFGPGATAPSDAALAAACPNVGWKQVALTPKDAGGGCSVRLGKKGMALGLGGVVKGWGVDRAVAALRARGLENFYVQAGGDLYLAGKKGPRPWRAGIRDPRGPPDKVFANLDVENAAFSTSGDYQHFFLAGGRRYHHLIDPRTCRPATASRSATVLARTATDAEFLTKALFIAGPKEGLALAESFGAQAVIVGADNRVHLTRGLEGRVQLQPLVPDAADGGR